MRRLVVAMASLALLVGVGASAAWGAPPLEGTHTVTITDDVFLSTRVAGTNLFTEEVLTLSLVGDATGTSTYTVHGVVHADGSAEYQGTGTFTGTLAGCGAVTYDFQSRFRISASGAVTGTSVTIGVSPVTYQDTYEGSVLSPIYTGVLTKYKC
jgi:hypothetical protein